MNKEIPMITLNKIKQCKLRIFEAEDDDYVDYRTVKANERAIERYLKDYSEDQRQELLRTIEWYDDDCASKLEKQGWKILRGKKK